MFNLIKPEFSRKSEIEKVFDRFFNDCWGPLLSVPTSWHPPVDYGEDDEKYMLSLEMPGVAKDDVEINIENNILKISGEKKRTDHHRTERLYGKFTRSFTLPDSVDRDAISAEFKDGILSLSVPKRPEVKPKNIPIK